MIMYEQQSTASLFSFCCRASGYLHECTRVLFSMLVAVGTIVVLTGCASTSTVKQIDRLESVSEHPRILIMEPDIKYYVLTTIGLSSAPHAEWTTAARDNFAAALKSYADERDVEVVMMTDSDQPGIAEIEYSKLHAAVGRTIQMNYFGRDKLPSKEGKFDWGLGPGVAQIGEKYNADYALFTYYRDYQASGGRVALVGATWTLFAIAALGGANAGGAPSLGSEQGFASLVDLKTGDIVWFNFVDAGTGELRDEQGAEAAVTLLFTDMPER